MRQDLPQTCLSHVYESCSRSANSRKSIVLFWSPDCGYCQAMLNDLKAWEANPTNAAPKLLVVSSGTVEANKTLRFRSPIVLDQGFSGSGTA
jgi:thiol-disulfide isomerase/thioredoxin